MKGLLHCCETGEACCFHVEVGFDYKRIAQLEAGWGAAKEKLVAAFLKDMGDDYRDPGKMMAWLERNNVPDLHWSWAKKAFFCNTDEYEWFFLICDDMVQAASIIFHPKESKVDGENIFYIDYLASAFWNRDSCVFRKRFSSTGKILIKSAVRYSIDTLRYRPGFSLHSLPSAEGYYSYLGMTAFEADPEKESLKYFEADAAAASRLMQEAL